VLPGEFLPEWLAALRAVLPLGAALSGIRDVVYFGGGHVLTPLLVTVISGRSVRTARTSDRRHPTRPGAAGFSLTPPRAER
jgi:hypothetical protein